MEAIRPRQYPELPRLVPAGWRWVGDEAERPEGMWVGADGDNAPIGITVREVEGHPEDGTDGQRGGPTDLGIYPLGSGDGRLHAAAVRVLVQQMPGAAEAQSRVAPPGTIVLEAPPIPADLLAGMLRAAGRAVTPGNVDVLGQMFVTQVKLKASQFIQNSVGHERAMAYLDRWALLRGGHLDIARAVLADLCSWNASVIPYAQDIPLRMRAIMLQVVGTPGTFWDDVT